MLNRCKLEVRQRIKCIAFICTLVVALSLALTICGAGKPITVLREPTEEEIQELEKQGYDPKELRGRKFPFTPRDEQSGDMSKSRAAAETVSKDGVAVGQVNRLAGGQLADMNSTLAFGIVAGLIEGILLGLLPLITGMKKNQPGLAIGGFFASLVAGIILGLILAIPTAAIFWWLIKKAENKSKDFKD